MTRKKGIYDLLYYTTKETAQTIVSAGNWKVMQDNLSQNYKDFINVKDLEHTSVPYIKIITSTTLPESKKEKEEYFYTQRK
jgi:hypothetical protein